MKKTADLPLILKSLSENGTFSGYASVFNIMDHDEEEVIPGAFADSLINWRTKGKMPKMLWQHDVKEIIGVWEDIYEDHCGLFVKGKLLLDVQKAREAYTLMQAGALDGLSVGFIPIKAGRNPSTRARQLKRVDLFEISLVTFAANPLAKVTRFKNIDPVQDYEAEMLHGLARIIQHNI